MAGARAAAITAAGEQQARSASGPAGSSQSRSVTPTAGRPALQQRDRAVDAAAHRDGDALGVRRRAEHRRERVRERVDGKRLAADGSRLEKRQPTMSRSSPGASAATIRSPSTAMRTAAHSPSRDESPKLSTMSPGYRPQRSGSGPRRERRLAAPFLLHPAVLRTYVNLTNQVGALPVSGARRFRRTRAPFHMALVLQLGPQKRTESSGLTVARIRARVRIASARAVSPSDRACARARA